MNNKLIFTLLLSGIFGCQDLNYYGNNSTYKSNSVDAVDAVNAVDADFKSQIIAQQLFEISEGGRVSPDGTEQVTCDIPVELRVKNTGGTDGAGLCVFTSIQFAALYQNVLELFEFQDFMKHYPGGGYPQKVEKMINTLLKSKNLPEGQVLYLQDTTGDEELLKEILKTRRVACVTYNGHDVHYNHNILHMVCLVHFTDKWAAILDNNYIGENQIVWMRPKEFITRWKANSGGWVFTLLEPPCPPVPKNQMY